jgi:hypothetical protein
MRGIDNIFQVIVPLTFLAIWVLTSLFNREAQPLPPRTGRPLPPGGPGTGLGASGGMAATARGDAAKGDPALRWASQSAPNRTGTRPPAGRPDDEIVIIDETRRPGTSGPTFAPGSAVVRTSGGGPARRGGRVRGASTPVPKRPEAAPQRALSGSVKAPLASTQLMARSLELSPLVMPASPFVATDQRDIARVVSEPPRPPDSPAPASLGGELRLVKITAAQLRESILMTEILRPPLALRGRRPVL